MRCGDGSSSATSPRPSGERPLEYGLIDEEVAGVFPDLSDDEVGSAVHRQYHLERILLKELQKGAERLATDDEHHGAGARGSCERVSRTLEGRLDAPAAPGSAAR